MAETTVSFVLEQLYKLALEEGTLLTGVHKDFDDIKVELESIHAFLKDADAKASDDGGGGGSNEGVKTWVKQLREASFRIEDVIDYYSMYMAQRVNNSGSGCMVSLKMVFQIIKTLKLRHQIASEMKDIKLSIGGIKERSERYEFKAENGPGCSRGRGTTQSESFGDPRMASLFIEETQVVGFESSRNELVRCLVEGTKELMLVTVVGMGGLGKTTLSNYVFNNQFVKKHFDCRSFITVSQSYTVRELLIDMVEKFCKDSNESIPKGLHKMDDKTLIYQVRQYLEAKRYLVFFDDVWKENFSDEIQHAIISNNKGSRIIVTTRMMHVAEYFKKSFHVHVHKLQPLSPKKAWELFCNKAFRYEPGKKCPAELEGMSCEMVQKCGGLPLAIVAIGGLLSTKSKTVFEWEKVSKNLRMELERNAHLTSLMKILSLSYDDLPYHLKSCMLYFGIYPEDYIIKRKRLTRQWMAEGFVKDEENRPLEEVAEEHMTELIHRSLVQVSKVGFDGKVKSCQVHDLLREVIIKKMKDLSFCHLMLPRSISKLVNIETLDLRQTQVHELPKEINKLTKLRLLPVYYRKYEGHYSMLNFTTGVQMQEGIGCLISLQKLYFLEADHGGIDLIHELKKLRQLRKLGIRRVRGEYGDALCATIQEMKHLESLNISAINEEEILDLDFVSTPPNLKVLNLKGRLTKLPSWIPKLNYLVKLRLGLSNFEHDPLDSLKNLPNLLRLNLWDDAFAGEILHFKVGGFPKLKELDLTRLNKLSSITIEKGALLSLEHFRFNNNPQLKVVPQDLQYLENLQFLGFADMPSELVESIDPNKRGDCHWIIKHIPLVLIRQKVGSRFHDYELYPIPTISNV
ncbi:unnamed protein product [Lathyrus sativus]|nr:unnamed protein product [Lathyrus sativus]